MTNCLLSRRRNLEFEYAAVRINVWYFVLIPQAPKSPLLVSRYDIPSVIGEGNLWYSNLRIWEWFPTLAYLVSKFEDVH